MEHTVRNLCKMISSVGVGQEFYLVSIVLIKKGQNWPRNGTDASHLEPGNIYNTHSPEWGKNIRAEAEVKVWSEADADFRRVVPISLGSQKSLCGSSFKNSWTDNHK